MCSSDMDASIPISSEETLISTREYQFPLENFHYETTQPSSQPLPVGYNTLGYLISGASSLYQNLLRSSTLAPSSGSFVSGPYYYIPIVSTVFMAIPTQPTIFVTSSTPSIAWLHHCHHLLLFKECIPMLLRCLLGPL